MKTLTRQQMKHVLGGMNEAINCTATATCADGVSHTCAGTIMAAPGGGTLGCDAQDGIGVTCYYESSPGHITYATYRCGHGPGWMPVN